MNLGNLTATLGVDSSQLKTAEASLRQFRATSDNTFGGMGSAASMAHGHLAAMVGTVAALVGVTVTLGGAFELVKKGIEEITSFNIGAISTAAMMLSRANVDGIEAQQAAYGNYKAYVLEMYEVLEAETQRHFASGKEMIGGFDAFARKGIYAAQEEAGAIGVITDAVKLLHRGYVDEGIMQHEIQGLLEGHAGIRFKLAQQLKGMLGETWKEQVQAAAQNGTLLAFLEEKFKGLGVAAGDIQKNLQAQATTFYTLISQVGRGGLGGLYEDIVGSVLSINDYLREHKDSLIVGIAEGWATVKVVVNDVKGVLQWMIDHTGAIQAASTVGKYGVAAQATPVADRTLGQQAIVTAKDAFWSAPSDLMNKVLSDLSTTWDWVNKINDGLVKWSYVNIEKPFKDANSVLEGIESIINRLIKIMNTPITWTIIANVIGLPPWLGGKGDFVGPPPPTTKDKTTSPDFVHQAGLRAAKMGEYWTSQGLVTAPDWSTVSTPKAPPWNPALDAGKDKGGKGAEAEINRLNSLFDTLTKDIARLSEGKLSAIEADFNKTVENIYKKSSDRAHSEAELEILAKTRSTLQKGKLQDDFDLKMAKGSGDAFLEISELYKKDLLDFGGLAGSKEKLDAFYGRQRVIKEVERVSEVLNLQKTYVDAMASASPIITDQLTWKKQALDLENRLAQAAITKTIAEKPYLAFLQDEMRAQQAFINQAKQYALARESWRTEGWQGGLKMGLVDSQNTTATWQADQVASFLKNAPQAISQQMASSFIGYLQGKKTDFDALAWSMGEKLIQTQLEGFLTQLLPQAIQGLMQLLGIKLPAELTAAQTAAATLEIGGYNAGLSIYNWCVAGAAVLQGKSSPIGDMLGGFIKIAGGLFGGGSPTSIGAPSYSPSPDTSWGNAAYANFLSSARPMAEGGIVTHPTLAVIAEAGRAEAVIPLDSLNQRSGPPQVNVIIYSPPNTEAKSEMQANGDVVVTFDQIGAAAYNRRGALYKAINSGGGAIKR
ncbi:MAG: hypothetical protein D4R73_05920 [Deltaproteobacteria bacterium]|nr:MAG: hypothetical protein D4R73_05920 [Deltaproteobacteria bacterium]